MNLAPPRCRRRAMWGPSPVEAPVRRTVLPRTSIAEQFCASAGIGTIFGRGKRASAGTRVFSQTRETRRRRRRFGLGALSHGPDGAFGLFRHLELRLERVADRALGDDAPFDLGPRRDLA